MFRANLPLPTPRDGTISIKSKQHNLSILSGSIFCYFSSLSVEGFRLVILVVNQFFKDVTEVQRFICRAATGPRQKALPPLPEKTQMNDNTSSFRPSFPWELVSSARLSVSQSFCSLHQNEIRVVFCCCLCVLFHPKPAFFFPSTSVAHVKLTSRNVCVWSRSNNSGLPRNNRCPFARFHQAGREMIHAILSGRGLEGCFTSGNLFLSSGFISNVIQKWSKKGRGKKFHTYARWILNHVQLICTLIGCPCVLTCEALTLPSRYLKSSSAHG